MSDRWQLHLHENGHVYEADLTGCAEIGRQRTTLEPLPSHSRQPDGWRVVVANMGDMSISRRHLEVAPLTEGRFLLCNRSTTLPVSVANAKLLKPGEMHEVKLPIVLQLGKKTLRLSPVEDDPIQCLPKATLAPGSGVFPAILQEPLGQNGINPMAPDQLMSWLQAFVGLLQSAAGSENFYVKAARALVDLVKLDSGRVLFRTATGWDERAKHLSTQTRDTPECRPSSRILNNVLSEKKTFWQVPELGTSTCGLDAVVAAPILNRSGEVIGALYGERRLMIGSQFQDPITPLEAMLVEVLASGVAAGLSRLDQERAALRTRLQMEQFFTPRLAAKLEDHPELLVGRDTYVSVLFCDIRGFSRIAERLGPAKTVELMSDVMSVLTQCVLDREGVVVDYVGDEIMGMWGAPDNQPDHAARACRAALAMFEQLPALNDRWQAIINEPIHIGVGINSGIAQVGNVGSRMKFKYGALGNIVNLGNRVQGTTKHLKSALLITDATRAWLDASFATRRLCRVRVVNIAEPVTVFELVDANKPGWDQLKQSYELALDEFTRGEFREASRILGQLIPDYPNDGPTQVLLARAIACQVATPEAFDPVLVLNEK